MVPKGEDVFSWELRATKEMPRLLLSFAVKKAPDGTRGCWALTLQTRVLKEQGVIRGSAGAEP